MKKLLSMMLLAVVVGCVGCVKKGEKGDSGDRGATGLPGNNGTNGIVLVKTYTGTMPSDGSFSLTVPEILNKQGNVIVQAYWTIPSAPNIWTPFSDGWLDNTTNSGHIFWISWSVGKVYFNYVASGDLYRVDVYSVAS